MHQHALNPLTPAQVDRLRIIGYASLKELDLHGRLRGVYDPERDQRDLT